LLGHRKQIVRQIAKRDTTVAALALRDSIEISWQRHAWLCVLAADRMGEVGRMALIVLEGLAPASLARLAIGSCVARCGLTTLPPGARTRCAPRWRERSTRVYATLPRSDIGGNGDADEAGQTIRLDRSRHSAAFPHFRRSQTSVNGRALGVCGQAPLRGPSHAASRPAPLDRRHRRTTRSSTRAAAAGRRPRRRTSSP